MIVLGGVLAFGCTTNKHETTFCPVEHAPITIDVLDDDTKQPVPKFQYQYLIRTPDGIDDMPWQQWQMHASSDGPIRLVVPTSCVIELAFKAIDYATCKRERHRRIFVSGNDEQRRFAIALRRGITVTGTVLDGQTRRPVPGARAIPMLPLIPAGTTPDDEAAVPTDQNGQFELRGVGGYSNIKIDHPSYVDAEIDFSPADQAGMRGREIVLKKGEPFNGRVTTRDGRPLSGARVSSRRGKCAETNANGEFAIYGLRFSKDLWGNGIRVEKTGFTPLEINANDSKANGMTFTLDPAIVLHGKVLTEDGKPVGPIVVMATTSAKPVAMTRETASELHAADVFALPLESKERHRIGVRADGCAVWEGNVDVSSDAPSLTITLLPGATVTGRVKLPHGNNAAIDAMLVPAGLYPAWLVEQDIGTMHAKVRADGFFAIPHVRPGDYRLVLTAARMTVRIKDFTVADAGVDLGIVDFPSTGRIVGRIFRPSVTFDDVSDDIYRSRRPESPDFKGWEFATGKITPSVGKSLQESLASWVKNEAWEITFVTDENGRYDVSGVPASNVNIDFEYAMSPDCVGAIARQVYVKEYKTIQVDFEPDDEDGSKAMDVHSNLEVVNRVSAIIAFLFACIGMMRLMRHGNSIRG